MNRKSISRGLALAAALAAGPAAAAADQLTSGQLQEFCSSKDAEVHNACRFYVLGVAEALGITDGVKGGTDRRVCIPEGVQDSDMVAAYEKSVSLDFVAFPQDRQMPAVSMLSAVLLKAYPCKGRSH